MTDTLKTINCPACGKIMEKHFIESGCAIDICTRGCGGMFFDNKEIGELNSSQTDVNKIKKILRNKKFKKVDENVVRTCPACGTKMVKTKVFNVQIDTCYNCNGIFLDKGEFELVRSHFTKRPKIEQIPMKKENGLDLSEFYEDEEEEKFLDEFSKNNIKKVVLGRKKISLLDIILSLIS